MKKGVISALSMVTGAIAGAAACNALESPMMKRANHLAEKHLAIMKVYSQWLGLKQEGKNLADFFERQGYKTIAVYGMSYLGESLIKELEGSSISVKYGIDQNAANIYSSVDVLALSDELPEVDAIVVTAFFFFDEIERQLADMVKYPILSLEDILYEI